MFLTTKTEHKTQMNSTYNAQLDQAPDYVKVIYGPT